MSAIEVTLPIRVVNELNDHSHWRGRQKRAKEQRGIVSESLRVRVRFVVAEPMPLIVTLTRIAPRKFDSDGVVASLKHVRDGVADALGVNDGDERIEWRYEQRRCDVAGDPWGGICKGYGVAIRIEAKP